MNSDLDAVKARRAALVTARAEIEEQRLALLAEDQDLEVTERVLQRLGDLFYGEPAPGAVLGAEPEAPAASSLLHGLLERGLSGGRKALDAVRSVVERRTDQ